MKKLGIQFGGFSVMNAGQKSSTINALPQLVANSTTGKFAITSVVSKALAIAVGENIMFINNSQRIEELIQQRASDVVAYATEAGYDIDSTEGQRQIVDDLTVYAIAKGLPKYDDKGNPIMASLRFTKEDKEKFIVEHANEILASNRDALIARNGGEDADDETLISLISVDDVESPKYHDSEGSKTATTGTATGIGCPLNFTDTAIWNKLKADLGDAKTKKNRVFNVLLENPIKCEYKSGNGLVEYLAYPIEFVEDVDPIIRGEKSE